jgi:hypothetical protein
MLSIISLALDCYLFYCVIAIIFDFSGDRAERRKMKARKDPLYHYYP